MTVYKGWNAKIYKDGVELGFAESASVEVATNLEAFYEMGSRQPVDLKEGNEEVTGSISKAWINGAYLTLVSPGGDTVLDEFTLCFELETVQVYCYLCKFEKGSLDIPQDGFLKEDYDFRAMTIAVVPIA